MEASLGGQLAEEPQLFLVRDVAPKKLMVEVSFRLPASQHRLWGCSHRAAAPGVTGDPTLPDEMKCLSSCCNVQTVIYDM